AVEQAGLGAQGVEEADGRAAAFEPLDDLEGGRLAQVGDIRLVRDADDEHARADQAAARIREHLCGPLDDARRPGGDLVHRLGDHGRRDATFAQLPQQVVRVARDAVPADAGAGGEGHEAVRLRGGRVDHLGDRDVELAADVGDLVGEGDVDGAKGVLEQL